MIHFNYQPNIINPLHISFTNKAKYKFFFNQTKAERICQQPICTTENNSDNSSGWGNILQD